MKSERGISVLSFPSLKILGGRVDSVSSQQLLSIIENLISNNKFAQIITVNSLMLLETEKDIELQKIFDSAELVIPDSVGISIIARLKKFKLIERIPGIDLIFLLCEKAEIMGWPVYLIGSRNGVAERAKINLQKWFPKLIVCGTRDGYFTKEQEKEILLEIENKKVKILFAGLSVPFQEKWIYNNLRSFQGMCAMGVGGSFDVISGDLNRAPIWTQKCGLEWLYRLIQQPWRWKRIVRIPLVFLKILFSEKNR